MTVETGDGYLTTQRAAPWHAIFDGACELRRRPTPDDCASAGWTPTHNTGRVPQVLYDPVIDEMVNRSHVVPDTLVIIKMRELAGLERPAMWTRGIVAQTGQDGQCGKARSQR